MPRTRRSISSSANVVLDQVEKNKSPLKSDDMTSPNCGDFLPKENLSLKKRTVSDRSPAIKSRKKTPGQQQGTPPIQNTNSTPIRSQEKNDPFLVDKENRTPGPTPYWKVAEERGMSPRLTRSAKKHSIMMSRCNSETSLDANSGVSRGLFQMEYSPPDPAEIRRMEMQKEKERDERLRQERRQEGEVYFLYPSSKQQPSTCASACEKNTCESSIHSGITLNSTHFEELQSRLHEKDKENASLKAEKNMLESNLHKLQQKLDETFAKWEVEKQKLIVDNAKLQGRIQAFQTPVLTDWKDFKNLEYRVEEMSQKLGEFNTERSQNRLDSEYGARVAEMERQIARLQQSLEKKEVELKLVTKDHEEAMAAAMNKLKHHESMKLTLNDCVRKLELEKNDASLRAKELSQEVEMMKTQLVQKEEMEKELRLRLNHNTTEVSNACNFEQEEEIRELCELNESQEQEICRLRQQVEHIQNMLSNENEKRFNLESEISAMLLTLHESKGNVDVLEAEKDVLKEQNRYFQSEISSLTLKLQDKTMECDNIRHEGQNLIEKVHILESECQKKDSVITGLKQDFASQEKKLLSELQCARSCLEEKECNFAMLQDKMVSFNERESELSKQILLLEQVRRSLHNRVIQLSGNIRVFVRVRPCIPSEEVKAKNNETPVSFPCESDLKSGDDFTKKFIVVTEPVKDRGGLSQRRKVIKFGFDDVFSPSSSQEDIWKATEPLIQSAVDGYNVCIFAYGQTGSGKTYTMLGGGSSYQNGLVTKAVKKLFDSKRNLESVSQGLSHVEISVELLEIYNEQVRDLLAIKRDGSGYKSLNISVNSNEAIGNIVMQTSSEDDVLKVLAMAQKLRCVKSTKSNEESSRSHLIFTVNFMVKDSSKMVVRKSKLHICDLAGSERLSKSEASGATLKETQHINKSLSTLSNVIEKLQQKSQHVPYRESKLTYLLRNSLGGDSKTLAIVCCNPLAEHYQETSCSLKFANKLSKVELRAMGNITC